VLLILNNINNFIFKTRPRVKLPPSNDPSVNRRKETKKAYGQANPEQNRAKSKRYRDRIRQKLLLQRGGGGGGGNDPNKNKNDKDKTFDL